MCTSQIVSVGNRVAVYSFARGYTFKREPELREEWRANPNAVLERLAREGRWDELEILMDRVPVH